MSRHACEGCKLISNLCALVGDHHEVCSSILSGDSLESRAPDQGNDCKDSN